MSDIVQKPKNLENIAAAQRYIDYARAIREEAATHLTNGVQQEVSLDDVGKVILILSSSRSGSSLLFHLLSSTEQVISLDGEHVPLYKLNGLGPPFNSFDSDRISLKDEFNSSIKKNLSDDFISGLGIGSCPPSPNFEDYACLLVMRLVLQWPQLGLSYEEWIRYVVKNHQKFLATRRTWNSLEFYIELLRSIFQDFAAVNPYYYDVPRKVVEGFFPECAYPSGPPNKKFLIEEAPFIMVKPRLRPTPSDIKKRPILIKAAVDAYRLPFLKALFPNATFKIIYLMRNPAASINGLYDGWMDRGFFSHNLSGYTQLDIGGYSNSSGWSRHWWKFDLPRGWEKLTTDSLEYVCGVQWFSANVHILESLRDEENSNCFRMKFEDLITSEAARRFWLDKIFKFMGIEFDVALAKSTKELPVVMASVSPSKRRWLLRKDIIVPVVMQAKFIELAKMLGYDPSNIEVWT